MARVVKLELRTRLNVEGIVGYIRRPVVPHGTGAKVTCPKEYLGKTAYLVITDEDWPEERPRRRSA
jgi:putative transposon-encoded protein